MRKIKVPIDSVPEFELGDTVVDIQRRRQEREARESPKLCYAVAMKKVAE